MKKLFVLLFSLSLAACQQHSVPVMQKPISYEGQTYRMDVAKIAVVDEFPKGDANSSHALAREMHKWADARLVAGGLDKVLEVHITDAVITKKMLPKQKRGLEGFFTKEQTEELSGKLAVDLKLYSPERSLPVAFAQVSAELSRTVREDASLEDRKAVHRQMVNEIMREIDAMLDEKIRNYFAKYLM